MKAMLHSLALLLLRVGFGCSMLFGHGLDKLLRFNTLRTDFADPLHLGSSVSVILAIGAEFFCSILVVLGIATRLATIPLIITMLVAAVIVHGEQSFADKEKALLYLVGFTTILLAGPGPFSLDRWLWPWRKKRA